MQSETSKPSARVRPLVRHGVALSIGFGLFAAGVCVGSIANHPAGATRQNLSVLPDGVKVYSRGSVGSGTIVIDDRGAQHVLTNAHVVGIDLIYEVEMADGSKRKAWLNDLVMLTLGPPEGIVE